MTEDRLQNLLRDADDSFAAMPPDTRRLVRSVRSRALRRKYLKTSLSLAAAACLIFVLCFALFLFERQKKTLSPQQLAALQQDIKRLNASADATLKLVTEVIERQNRIENLQRLNAQLTRYVDPYQQLRENLNKTAFILLDRADEDYKQFNDIDSAVEAYNRIVEFFPDTPSAEKAKQKLVEIQKEKINNFI
jgi:hypothetical protein